MSFKKILASMLAVVAACGMSANALTLDVAETAEEEVTVEATLAAETTVDTWDGTVDVSWYDDSQTEFTITTAEQFAGLAYLVNGAQSYNPALDNKETADFGYYCGKTAKPTATPENSINFAGKTINLAADLDLCAVYANGDPVILDGGEQLSMVPVGYSKYTPFKGTFNGNGHTIKNLFQGGWDLYGMGYKNVYLGLFGAVEDATIKNLVIDNFAFNCEINLGAVAGRAGGTSTFDNITVKNSVVATGGGWWVGGIVGWGYGNLTFNKIVMDETTTVAQTGGNYDTAVGGIIGGCNNVDGETLTFKDCYVACKLDVFNDRVANYNTGVERNCGMIIGGVGEDNELMIDGKKYPDFKAKGITCENVKVVIGEWANYTYCWSYELPMNCQRVEAGVGYNGVDVSKLADYSLETVRFDAIFGAENAGDLSNVRGPVTVDVMKFLGVTGVEVINEAIVATYEVKVVKAATLSSEAYDGATYYATLEEAIANVTDGDTIYLLKDVVVEDGFVVDGIKLTIDLGGFTLALADTDNNTKTRINHKNGANVTYTNGTIDVSAGNDSVCFFGCGVYDTTKATMTFDGVTVNGENYNSGYAVFYPYGEGSVLNIKNSTINLKGERGTKAGVIKSEGTTSNVNIEKTTMVLEDVKRGFVNSVYAISDSDIEFKNLNKSALRNFSGTITDTKIDIDNADYGLENDSGKALAIEVKGNSEIKITNCKTEGVNVNANTAITVEDEAKFATDNGTFADGSAITGTVINKAEQIYVQYKKVDLDTNGDDNLEGADKYEIVLVGYDATVINELASADLTFNFVGTPVTGAAMAYDVAPAKGVTLTKLGDRYMFNYNGVEKYEETGKAIVIGTLTVSGYGKYTLGTNDTVTTNAVYATEIRDNIVEGFEDAAKLVINTDAAADDGMVGNITDGSIAVPTRTLTVNVAFPNSVNDNEVAVQDMKVEITGNIDGVQKTVTYDLGGNMTADGTYVVTEDRLVLNDTYNVVVSGAGYRTARYTVTMTDAKTLNFWNNVKDNKVEVEEGKASSATEKNFLAGDIVADNQINIYDLSAVVSYFATSTSADYKKYTKYDLNRDGTIDSKDVAYVLVSWNK